jgi:hypothetical protein
MGVTVTNIDPSQLLMVYATTDTVSERIEEDPPQIVIDTDDEEFRKNMLESAKRGAYAYDAYRDLRQISFAEFPGPEDVRFTHFMFCDDPGVDIEYTSVLGEERSIYVFDVEFELLSAIGDFLSSKYVTCQGTDIQWRTLSGWKVHTDIWPLVLNKMLKHNIHIPEALQTDASRRFSTVKHLFDVSNIYAQGVSMNMRKLPSCGDTLKYWGYQRDGKPHATPDLIRKLVCDAPDKAPVLIEPYLEDMFDITLRYNNIGEPWRTV